MNVTTQQAIGAPPYPGQVTRLDRRKLLLACGVAFPVLWVGIDVVSSLLYDGYSYVDQTVSELSAIDAPPRPYWLVSGTVYNILAIAFGAGIWRSWGGRRALRVVAGLFIAYAVLSLLVGPFSSMHQREVLAADGATLSDTLHLALVGIGGITYFAQIAFAVTAFGRRFRLYSLVTALAMLVFGFVTSLYAPDVQDNNPTPGVGIYERISAYGYMLWVVVLAATLWRHRAAEGPQAERK